MQCTLLIPHFFWRREAADAVLRDVQLPALQRILARARAERMAAQTMAGWLCRAFEVEKQHDWPIAPLTLELDGGEAGNDYWLRADPVHVKLERDRLLLVDSALFDVTPEEAESFTNVLNAHFAADGFLFEARAPKRWYVRVGKVPALSTRQPEEIAGQDIQRHLPEGADALRWHRVANEAQMLLHEHALNDARESRGEAAINSIWLWGGGTRPRVYGRHFTHVWSDDALAAALGSAADVPARGLPADAQAWLSASGSTPDTHHLVVLADLANATHYGDVDAWRTRAMTLEEKWLAPLSQALRDGRLTHLTLATPGTAASWRFDLARADLWKFWRAAKPLAEYA